MKFKPWVMTFFFASFGLSSLHAQQNCITNNTFSGCANNVSNPCNTFYHTSCSGWTRSHGTPEIITSGGQEYIEMISNVSSGVIASEGIFTPFQFIQGNNYDVLVSGSFYGSQGSPTANGSFSVYAASGVSSQTLTANCQDPAPAAPSRQALYTLNANNQNYTLNADLQTFNQVSSAFDQVWIYPTNGSSHQVNLDLTSIFVCVSCNAVATYSSGTLPYQVNGKDITIEIPAQPVNTLVQVTDAIFLKPGFKATATGSVTFVAEISPCITYTNYLGLSEGRGRDSSSFGNFSIGDPLTTRTDSALAGLRVYPTVSTGIVTLIGNPADLDNSNIVVLNETGQIMYQMYNAGATTLELKLGNLANGLYFIQVRQQSKVTTQKILISK